MNTAKLVSITKARQVTDLAIEARSHAATSAAQAARDKASYTAEEKVARLTNPMTTADAVLISLPKPYASVLILAAGVAVWSIEVMVGAVSPVLHALLGLLLSGAVVASARWDSGEYPRLRFPAHIVLPLVVLVLGSAAVVSLCSFATLVAWAAPTVAASGLLLQQSLSAWQLRRDWLARHAALAQADLLAQRTRGAEHGTREADRSAPRGDS